MNSHDQQGAGIFYHKSLLPRNRKEQIHGYIRSRHRADTPTEQEILRLIALGHSVKEIAAMRFNSEFTISTHKKNIFSKLGVNNAHDATKYALRTGIIDLVDYYI